MQVRQSLKNLKMIWQPNVIWSILGIGANALYATILIIFVTRVNGMDKQGVFSFIFYISSIFQTIGNYGGRIYQVSDIKGKYSDNTYISLKAVTAAIMIVSALFFCFGNGYSQEKLFLMLIFVGYRFFENISEACFGVLQKNNRLDIIGKSMFFKAVLSTALFILLNYLTKNLLLSSASFILVYLVFFLFYDWKKTKAYSPIKFLFTMQIKELAKESFQVFLYTFFNIFILNITRYFVDWKADDTVQGYFTSLVIPVSLISLVAQFLIQPMVTPLVEEYAKNKKGFARKSIMALLALFGIGIVAAVVSYFILVDVWGMVNGVSLQAYRVESFLLVLSGICSGGTTIISMLLVIMRKLTGQTIVYIISAIVAILVSWIMVSNDVSGSLYAYMTGLFIQFLLFAILFLFYVKKAVMAEGEKNND